MKIEHRNITVRDLVKGYADDGEGGVRGFDGKLDIRPAYQREFVYKDKQRNAVIETVRKSYPLNVMYWVDREDGTYEVMDGQQRTISIGQFVAGDFSLDFQFFHNLTDDERDAVLDYELSVYVCRGTDSEKLEWFRTINIAGEKLTDQELRNAVYTGTWLADAKTWFSRASAPAARIGSDYIVGSPIRQDYLEKALLWISKRDGIEIEDYMAKNQKSKDASELWNYFQSVIGWVKIAFPNWRKEMRGVNWGMLYNGHRDDPINASDFEARVVELMQDEDVTAKKGIYPYLITGDERWLSVRAFSPNQKREAFERQGGVCPVCKGTFAIDEMEADHIDPWSKGGRTTAENCQMLCAKDNRTKSNV